MFAPQWHGSGSGSHTSLKNLLNRAQCEEREGRCRGTIWVVCDVDDNETHRELLMKWRAADSDHRSALQGVSIEGWFLQHLDKPSRPTSSGEALRLVKRQWGGYKKGGEVQKWLIERTDEACRRERQFLGGARNDDVWPVDRSSQMPLLITYLDERARDWALRDSGGMRRRDRTEVCDVDAALWLCACNEDCRVTGRCALVRTCPRLRRSNCRPGPWSPGILPGRARPRCGRCQTSCSRRRGRAGRGRVS